MSPEAGALLNVTLRTFGALARLPSTLRAAPPATAPWVAFASNAALSFALIVAPFNFSAFAATLTPSAS